MAKIFILLPSFSILSPLIYDDANKDFHEYVENFGFETNWGSFSDISIICPSWGVSGVNLSVGYEDEHFEIERLFISTMQKTILKVCKMFNTGEI